MNMRLFSLVPEGESPSVKLQIKIVGSLNGFADSDIAAEEYSSLKEMFGGVSKALKDSEFIIIAVAESIYNKSKQKITAALSLKCEQNQYVLERLSKLNLDAEASTRNALMPVDSTVFLSADGINSGFAVKKGKQTIALIPLDDNRTDSVLKRGLVPYITNGGKLVQSAPVNEPVKEEIAEDKPKLEQPKPMPHNNSVAADDEKLALTTLNILREADVTIAVNGNANSATIRQLGGALVGFDDFFTFTPHIEDRGDYNVTDYTAQMAKSAKGLSNATLGACISDIFTTDECDFICIAVATDKSALVRKLYKEADETDEQFIKIAAEELFALIGEKASGNNAVGIEIAQDEAPKKTSFFKKKSGKITLSVIALVIVAAIVVGALYYVKNKAPVDEIITTTVPTTAEITTEAVVETENMPLSMLIRYEMINGINKNDIPVTTTKTTSVGAIVPVTDDNSQTEPAQENAAPSVIKVNGESLDAKEAIARIVESEMDKSFSVEAIKAQAVVTYTYLKYRDTDWVISGLALADAYSQEVYDAVDSVFGQYITYNNETAFTPYCFMSAGKTTTADIIFGTSFDYLKSVTVNSDKQRDNYKLEALITADEIRAAVAAYDDTITLVDDVSTWLSVTEHDAAVSTGTGYVVKMQVGDKEVSGVTFIYDIMKSKNLASPCFSLSFNAENNTYTITTFGSGLGVGMSQQGADRLAVSGTKYGKIIDTYYPGTVIANN